MSPPREVQAAIRDIERHEEASARRLLALLAEARVDLRQRLALADDGSYTQAVLRRLEDAVAQATELLRQRMTASLTQDAVRAAELGRQLADRTLPDLAGVFYRIPSETLDALGQYHATLVQGVTEELRSAITRSVQLGLIAGKSVSEVGREVLGRGLKPLGPFRTASARADAIARTEMNRVANTATHARYREAAREIPGLRKRWLSARDARVRPTHAAANGQTVGVDETFEVGGYRAQYPLDPALPAKETVRCRCRSVAVLPEG